MINNRYKKASKQPFPVPYYCQALYLEACSILPERKHRRCFEGSQRERIGRVIRSRCNTIQTGTVAGLFRSIAGDLIARICLSRIVKLFAIVDDRYFSIDTANTEIILNHAEITLLSKCASSDTLKCLKDAVKRICIREMMLKTGDVCREIPAKRMTTRFPGRNFLTGGGCFKNLQIVPFLSRLPKV